MESSKTRRLKDGSKWRVVQKHFITKKTKSQEVASTWQTLVGNFNKGATNFFGISKNAADDAELKAKWNLRLKQLYGEKGLLAVQERVARGEELVPLDTVDLTPRKKRKGVTVRPKDNVLKIAYDAFKGKKIVHPALKNRSFTQSALEEDRTSDPGGWRKVNKYTFFDKSISTGQPYKAGDALDRDQVSAPPFMALPTGFLLKRAGTGLDEIDGAEPAEDKIDGRLMEELSDNSKREAGTGGVFGRWVLGLKRDRSKISSEALQKLDASDDFLHRPFFTYWVTFVQIVCYIVTVSVYGLAPIGFHETNVEGEVLSSGLYVQSVNYVEKDNLWIGPRQADLIHLGAKYSPCMRRDSNVEKAITFDREKENNTACCVRNDGAGCVQTPKSKCSSIMSTWLKKDYGTVCGQDPEFCLAPASVEPYEWPSDIIDWPICITPTNFSGGGGPPHMTCNLAGKPCCIGIQGECMVTTREYCQFLRGYFHEEAFLCSQISCMSETCGMIPFWNPTRPDQIYRLWISLFIHAGLLQLIITILFQFFIMRDVEKMMGWFRTCLVYILSGVVGSLASAIFVPYHVEAGPSGSQFGIIACLFVELISNWNYLINPYVALVKLIFLLLLLFVIGLLPMIDNYAHLFGFIYGFLLSFSIMPHVTFNISQRRKKLVAIFVCFFGSILILVLLILLFYVIPIYDCPYCQYFSCVPLTENFCDTMEVKIRRIPA